MHAYCGSHGLRRYADGWLNDEQGLGYPDAWLKETNYTKGPPPVPHLGNGD